MTSKYILAGCSTLLYVSFAFAQLQSVVEQEHFSILERNVGSVVDTQDISDDPLRKGTYTPVKEDNFIGVDRETAGVQPELADKTLEYDNNYKDTMTLIRRILNYILGFSGLVTLGFLIFYGFKIVTSSEEDASEEAGKKIKTSFIALGGIALSFFMVSFVYYVIEILIR